MNKCISKFTLLNAGGQKEMIEWCMNAGLIASSYECPKQQQKNNKNIVCIELSDSIVYLLSMCWTSLKNVLFGANFINWLFDFSIFKSESGCTPGSQEMSLADSYLPKSSPKMHNSCMFEFTTQQS